MPSNRTVAAGLVVALLAQLTLSAAQPAGVSVTTLPDGISAAGHSIALGQSDDGRQVLFVSDAPNLTLTQESSPVLNLFLRDTVAGETRLISADPSGQGGANAATSDGTISGDGRYIAFASAASNLAGNDTNGEADLFLHDVEAGTTLLITTAEGSLPALRASSSPVLPMCGTPLLSADGALVAFESDATNLIAGALITNRQIYLYQRSSGAIRMISAAAANGQPASADCRLDSMSADGRYVAYTTTATNLVAGVGNISKRVYVRDTLLRLTYNGSGDAEFFFPVIAFQDGQFSADGSALVIRAKGPTGPAPTWLIYVPWPPNGATAITTQLLDDNTTSISADGQRVVYAETTGGAPSHIALWEASTGIPTVLSTAPGGSSHGNGPSRGPVISADGSTVAFLSTATDLVPGVGNGLFQIFTKDLASGQLSIISTNDQGELCTESLEVCFPRISADGSRVLWDTTDETIVEHDRNRSRDLFLHYSLSAQNQLLSTRALGLPNLTGNGPSRVRRSGSGLNARYTTFSSHNALLGSSDTNAFADFYLAASIDTAPSLTGPGLPGPLAGLTAWPAPSFSGNRYVCFPLYQRVSGLALNDEGFGAEEFIRYDLASQDAGRFSFVFPVIPAEAVPAASSDGRWIAYPVRPLQNQGQGDMVIVNVARATTHTLGETAFTQSRLDPEYQPPQFSPDDQWLLFQSRANGYLPGTFDESVIHLYAVHLPTLTPHLISRAHTGEPLDVHTTDWSISADGRWVAFTSDEGTNSTIRIHDLVAQTNRTLCAACNQPSLNADGSKAAYIAISTDLAEVEHRDVMLQEVGTGQTSLVSVNFQATGPANDVSRDPTLSFDARFLTFASLADDLAPNDDNQTWDLYARDLVLETTTLLTRSYATGAAADGPSLNPILAADGRTVFFNSFAHDLISGDYNGHRDVFVVSLHGPDTDGDDLDDDWEVAHFNTLDQDGSDDFDLDGHTDAEEFLTGTSPTDPQSILHMGTPRMALDGTPLLSWNAIPGKSYRLQANATASPMGWIEVSDEITPAGTVGRAPDPSDPLTAQRYYQVRLAH